MIKIIATALEDLPVAEEMIKDVLQGQGELEVIPLPFHSLENVEKPSWFESLINADALFIRSGIVDKWLIDQLKNCKVITLHGVGVDQVDVNHCKTKGIIVTNVPGGNANAAAELTIGLMLDALRGISFAHNSMLNKDWDKGRKIGNELGSQKVGIIGMGNIGQKVAQLCSLFGSEVAYYDKYHETEKYKKMELKDLLKWSSIISIHIPLNNETKDLIGLEELKLLGEDGIIINVARGAIINEDSLSKALSNNTIRWAACDVFSNEPPNFNNSLFSRRNITMTPHIGGSTFECLDTIAKVATNDIIKAVKGQNPDNKVV